MDSYKYQTALIKLFKINFKNKNAEKINFNNNLNANHKSSLLLSFNQ